MTVIRLPQKEEAPKAAPPDPGGLCTIQNDSNAQNSGVAYALPVYPRGTLATRSVLFTVNGVATNPTAVTCTLVRPDGVTTNPTPTPGATGVYTCLVDTSPVDGRWVLRWVGTTACAATVEDVFFVQSGL